MLSRLEAAPAIPAPWLDETDSLKGLPIENLAEIVNGRVNRFKYIEDAQNWGKSDYWETPAEFYERGGGDCEGFAIAKYAWLKSLGVPEEKLRIAIVYDDIKARHHAVLTVDTGEERLVLDNQNKTIRKKSELAHYKPVYSINSRAWWLEGRVNAPG